MTLEVSVSDDLRAYGVHVLDLGFVGKIDVSGRAVEFGKERHSALLFSTFPGARIVQRWVCELFSGRFHVGVWPELYHHDEGVSMASFLKRRANGDRTTKQIASQALEAADPAFAKKYPALAEFLATEEWEPGVPRERGTLTLFFEDGQFKVAVNDRDQCVVAFLSKGTFPGLLDALEKGLQGDGLDWRGQKGKQPNRGRRS
jgi:hypothetical protein